MIRFSIFILLLINYSCVLSQDHDITVRITNQPDNQVILGSVKGDKFTPLDSAKAINGMIIFRIPSDFTCGVYRLILGQTTYARVMNEPPQQLDLIYNNENIELSTDFKNPEDSLRVIRSEENSVWYTFLQKEKELHDQIKLTEKELDYYRSKNDLINTEKSVTQYNLLQKERTSLIEHTINNHPDLFASKLIKMYREPFLDGNLDSRQRNQIFRTEYFDKVDFTDEKVLNSAVYTDKVFRYLMSYARKGLTREQQLQEFKNAIDIILANTSRQEKIYELILDYLVSGFEKLNLDELISYIAVKYSCTTCQTDDITTLERKLEAQKMKIGTVVPDFTMNDLNGDPVNLSDILKSQNLILFWATWCPHCNEMIPEILDWQKSSGVTDFEIIAISLDEKKELWQEKVFKMGIESWYNFSSLKKWDCDVAIDYNVYATPTIFVIDKNRNIIGKPLTLRELKTLIL